MNDTLIAARGLRTWFELKRFGFLHEGFVRAVDGVDFEIARGEAVAFVGESGCGKSSLARTLLGLYRPTAGRVLFDGREMFARRDRRERLRLRARLGYIQQDPYGALAPFMDVRRILAEPLVIHGVRVRAERERRIRAALEEVRLTPPEEFLPKFPHMLSGGQQQRVSIARALILKPEIIVADEPVSMIDASVRIEILNLLRAVQQARGLAVAYITHDLSTVRYFAGRIFVMYAGQIVEKMPVSALPDGARHPYTRALLSAVPDPDPENALRFKEIPGGEPPSLLHPPAGCRFHPRCPKVMPGLCDKNEPPEFEPCPGHFSACWLEDRPGPHFPASSRPG